MDYCMCAYGAKNSDRQIKNSPIPTENKFAKFNARQIFLLYDMYTGKNTGITISSCPDGGDLYHYIA